MSGVTLALLAALVLASFHAAHPLLLRLPDRRQVMLENAGAGAGLAYVSLYLLFELMKDGAAKIYEIAPVGPDPLELLCILLLVALTVNYLIVTQLEKRSDARDHHLTYVVFFFTYNMLVGGGLVEEARWGPLNLGFYVLALGVHLLFNDLYLQHIYPRAHRGRWRALLAAGPLIGAASVLVLAVPAGVLYAVLAWIAGGTLIHVFRRELPEVGSVRPLAFVAGASTYAALVFATWRF